MIRLQWILLGFLSLPLFLGSALDAQQVAHQSVFNQRPDRISRLDNVGTGSYWRGVAPNRDGQANATESGTSTYYFGSDEDEVDDQSDESDNKSDNGPIKRATNLTHWPETSLSEIRLDIREFSPQIPDDQSARLLNQYARDWNSFGCLQKTLLWDAPNIRYMPLMYEDVALERYGQVVRDDYFQTVVSAAHFFSSTALFPIHAIHDPVYSCDTPLGYCRPGNCTQRIYQRQFWRLTRNVD